MTVNFSPRQFSELITSILGRGEIPLKFVYMTEDGARAWGNLAATRGTEGVRGINHVEANLLTSKVDSFLHSFEEGSFLNIIDVGCGEGSPVLPLLESLTTRNVQFRYVPVDISDRMLEVASDTIRQRYSTIDIRPKQLDFEHGNFADITYELRDGYAKNLLLFLGSTLGNQADRHRVLTNLRDSMTSEDYVIIGVELVNLSKTEKLLSQYHGPIVEDFVFAMANTIGLKSTDGDLNVRFNSDQNQIELSFRLKTDTRITIGSDSFILEKDEHLLLARSHKFSEWIFVRVLQEAGFRIELLTTSKEKGYSLVMCQPSRFSY
jgi:uncharacterized SAM-dependent methyltransferase